MFETLAPHVGAPGQVLRRVKRLFPLLEKGFRQVPATNALIRTTYAVTMIEGGTAPNVLPGKVEAVINARILQGESVESVLKDLRKILGEEVEIEIEMREEPSKVTPSDTEEFSLLREAIEHHFGDVIVAPYLMSGATDARHYGPLSRHIFRFSPVVMEAEEVSLVHSADERISIENLEKGYLFFRDYIRQRSMR